VDSAKLLTSARAVTTRSRAALSFALRTAFVQDAPGEVILNSRATSQLLRRVIRVRGAFEGGLTSRESDFDRIQLQRVQFETDLINAQVNLRTANDLRCSPS